MVRNIYDRLPSPGFWRLLIKFMAITLAVLIAAAPFVGTFFRHRFMASQAERIQKSLDTAQEQVNYSLRMVDSI